MIFETKRHIEVSEGFQGFELTEFLITGEPGSIENQIMEILVRFNTSVEKRSDKTNLRSLFKWDELTFQDLRKFNKQEAINFLNDILNEPDWGDDKAAFAKLMDRYSEITKDFTSETFYFIDKKWLDPSKLNDPENWVYSYYFLILHQSKNSIVIIEWVYD